MMKSNLLIIQGISEKINWNSIVSSREINAIVTEKSCIYKLKLIIYIPLRFRKMFPNKKNIYRSRNLFSEQLQIGFSSFQIRWKHPFSCWDGLSTESLMLKLSRVAVPAGSKDYIVKSLQKATASLANSIALILCGISVLVTELSVVCFLSFFSSVNISANSRWKISRIQSCRARLSTYVWGSR